MITTSLQFVSPKGLPSPPIPPPPSRISSASFFVFSFFYKHIVILVDSNTNIPIITMEITKMFTRTLFMPTSRTNYLIRMEYTLNNDNQLVTSFDVYTTQSSLDNTLIPDDLFSRIKKELKYSTFITLDDALSIISSKPTTSIKINKIRFAKVSEEIVNLIISFIEQFVKYYDVIAIKLSDKNSTHIPDDNPLSCFSVYDKTLLFCISNFLNTQDYYIPEVISDDNLTVTLPFFNFKRNFLKDIFELIFTSTVEDNGDVSTDTKIFSLCKSIISFADSQNNNDIISLRFYQTAFLTIFYYSSLYSFTKNNPLIQSLFEDDYSLHNINYSFSSIVNSSISRVISNYNFPKSIIFRFSSNLKTPTTEYIETNKFIYQIDSQNIIDKYLTLTKTENKPDYYFTEPTIIDLSKSHHHLKTSEEYNLLKNPDSLSKSELFVKNFYNLISNIKVPQSSKIYDTADFLLSLKEYFRFDTIRTLVYKIIIPKLYNEYNIRQFVVYF